MVSLRIRSFAGLAAASAGAMLATSLGNTASAAEERDASRVIEEIVVTTSTLGIGNMGRNLWTY